MLFNCDPSDRQFYVWNLVYVDGLLVLRNVTWPRALDFCSAFKIRLFLYWQNERFVSASNSYSRVVRNKFLYTFFLPFFDWFFFILDSMNTTRNYRLSSPLIITSGITCQNNKIQYGGGQSVRKEACFSRCASQVDILCAEHKKK